MDKALAAKNKTDLTKKTSSLPSNGTIPGLPVSDLRKSLNWASVAIAVGFYTLFCAYLGSIYFTRPDSLLGEQQKLISLAEQTISKLEQGLNKRYHYTTNQEHQMKRLEGSIKTAIVATQSDYERKIQIKDSEIESLKADIRDLNTLLAKNMDKHFPKSETLTYSPENSRVIKYDHNQKLRRFKDAIDMRKDAFIKTLNMQEQSDRAKWQSFQDNLDREYVALQEKLFQKRINFRKQKYMVLND